MAITTTRSMDDDLRNVIAESIIDEPRYDLGIILAYIQDNVPPENIYDRGELDQWAENNGYVKSA